MTTSDPNSPPPDDQGPRAASARVDALLRVLDRTEDARERAEILIDIAIDLRDGLRDGARAFDALMQAWRADPMNDALLDHLEPLARELGRWTEILEATSALVASERDPARALAYSEAMVRWLTREVPMQDHAFAYLERVRQIDSTHWLLHLFQAARYEECGDRTRELEELDLAVLSAKRPDDRARIHLLMAKRYCDERAANPVEAKAHFLAAHALMPRSMEALRGLEQVHLRDGDLPALAEVLEKQADATAVEEEQLAVLLRLADLYERQFLKPEMAVEKLERAFVLDPSRMEIFAGLERCYTTMRAWDDLVRVLELAFALVDDPQERAERLVALAETLESKLGDLAGAVKAYERLEKFLPDDETLVGELARLTEKMGDWEAAVRHRTRLADLVPDARTRARMHVMAGQLLLGHDPQAARLQFERAVTFDPPNAAAWNALLSQARRSGELGLLAEYLEQRAASTETARARAQIQAELGNVRHDLGDEAGALAAWETAIAADPNSEAAARPLLDVYVTSARYADAAAICDVVLHAAERDGDTGRLFAARQQSCRVAVQVGRPVRALDLALAAFQLRPDAREAVVALIECAWAMRTDPLVLGATQALGLIADSASSLRALAPETRAQLGEILALTGDRQIAGFLFEGVLAEQPDNAAALRGLSGLHAARGESITAWSLKRQLAETTGDDAERFGLLVEAGDGFANDAKRRDLAVQVYEQARAIRPNDRALLHKLVAQYQALEDWQKVSDVLRAIADDDEDLPRKAKVVITMGQIAYRQLENRTAAVELFDEALDIDPTRLDVFERVVALLTEVKDWPRLEPAYRRMLARAHARGDVPLEHALVHQLGLVYRDRLGNHEGAVACFRAAVALGPDDELDQTILRELLTTSGHAMDAAALTLERVRRDPLEPLPYPALYDLLAALGQADRAWCVASVMAHVDPSHEPAARARSATPPPAIGQIPGTLGAEGYRRLLHPDLDPTLTAILEVMAAAAIEVRVSQLGFRERLSHPGPSLTEPEPFLRDVNDASRILGVVPPRLFSAKAPPAIGVAVTQPPSLLVHLDSLSGIPPDQTAFWIGKRLAELTPPLLARGLFRSVTELKDLVAAAARIVQEKPDKQNRADEPWRARVRKDRFAELSLAVERALAGGALDVRRWSHLADLSASRAGLVIAGDLEVAKLGLAREAQFPGDLGRPEQIRELVSFFLSEDYARIRAMLGVCLP